MARVWFSNLTTAGEVSSTITGSDTSVTVTGYANPPSVPHYAVLDRGEPAEEIVLVTAIVGSTLTITRGQDGTSATTHNTGATLEHAVVAGNANEWEGHSEADSDVHGVTGDLVGATGAQTITNKTIEDSVYEATNTISPGTGPLYTAIVNNTSREGFSAVTTGTGSTGIAFLVEQSGSDRFAVHADGSVVINPSGSPTASLDVTGHAAVSGNATIGGTLGVTGLLSVDDVTAGGDINAATLTTSGGITSGSNVTVTGNVTGSGTVQGGDLAATDDLTVGDDATITGSLTVEGGDILTAAVSADHARIDTEVPAISGVAKRSARQPLVHYVSRSSSATGFDGYGAVVEDYTWTQRETGNIRIEAMLQGKLSTARQIVAYGQEYDWMIRLRNSGGTLLEQQTGWRMFMIEFAGEYLPVSQMIIDHTSQQVLTGGQQYTLQLLADRLTGGTVAGQLTSVTFQITEVAIV